MKHLRLWLLVVLAALLPLRGAMAAAMMCPPALAGHAHQAGAAEHDAHAQHHAHAHHDAGPASGTATSQDTCTMCAAFCSITPLPSTVPGLPEPAPAGATTFPDPGAPAPTFLSDGQERPPRST